MKKSKVSKIAIIAFLLLCIGCNYSAKMKANRLNDTLAALKKKCDFKPLNQRDAYDFINKYYLPRLDSLRTKRKIFIHPINGVDFNELFKNDKTQLENEYAKDSTHKIPKATLIAPPPPLVIFNEKFSWDIKKLSGVVVIKDYATLKAAGSEPENIDIKAWHRKYGYGYMCISYPQYNSFTKRLVIREWLEDGSFCGTGRLKKFWFQKVRNGWKAY